MRVKRTIASMYASGLIMSLINAILITLRHFELTLANRPSYFYPRL
jgi:hypothetical protein